MNRVCKIITATALLALFVGTALATPIPNSAATFPRVWNDTPFSTLTITNSYPALVSFNDVVVPPAGWANLHNWRLSQDGTTAIDFANEEGFVFSADLTITGPGTGEAGLQIAPWWSATDGRFNVRSSDGEVACFGGRLPFHYFGNIYVAGTTVRLTIIYTTNSGMDAANPATIEYIYDNGSPITSGPLAFDEGNPAENPPHGVFGILSPARVGGYMQYNNMAGQPGTSMTAAWGNITFQELGIVVPNDVSSWGDLKALFR